MFNNQIERDNILTADFNGDGFTDILKFNAYKNNNNQILHYTDFEAIYRNPNTNNIHSYNQFTTIPNYFEVGYFIIDPQTQEEYQYNLKSTRLTGDFDGNGTIDLLLASTKRQNVGTTNVF